MTKEWSFTLSKLQPQKRERLKLQPVRNLTICTIFCAGREALIPGSVNPGNFIIYQNDTPSVFYNKSSFCSIFHFMCRWWNFLKLLEPTNLRKKHLIFSLCQCIVGLDENLLSLLGKSLCWEERVVLPDFTKPVNTERDGVQHWVWMEKRVFITNQTKSVKKQEQKEMLKKKRSYASCEAAVCRSCTVRCFKPSLDRVDRRASPSGGM